jgi:hypothetical protein
MMKFEGDNLIINDMPGNAAGKSRKALLSGVLRGLLIKNRGNYDDVRMV